jgi:hypothetical protein
MTDEEELKLKREENEKLNEEGDRLFFVRLGRVALIISLLTPTVILPGFAAWRALEVYCQSLVGPALSFFEKPFFWNNYVWLLLSDLYAVGAFGILFILVYLTGGTRGLKLCWFWDVFSGKQPDPGLLFWLIAFATIACYAIFVLVGIFCITFYVAWIK